MHADCKEKLSFDRCYECSRKQVIATRASLPVTHSPSWLNLEEFLVNGAG